MPLRMHSGERRQAIIDSAIRLFAEKGFRGTTTRELAASVGVTEPVLYRHFRTKHDLYCAIIEAKAERASGQVSGLQEIAAGGDDAAFFGAVAELVLRRYEEDPDTVRLLLFSCLERHELSGLFYDRLFLGFFQLLAGYIRERIRQGAFHDVSPEIAARTFIGMAAYHGLLRLLFPDKVPKPDRRKAVREVISLFLRGVLDTGRRE